jgi:hypothetical protein
MSLFSRPPTAIAVANEFSLVDRAANGELTPADWVFVSFGEYPCASGLQIVNAESSATVANEINEAAKSPLFRGRPVYIGHPDHKAFRDRYKDTRSYARVWEAAVDVANEQVGFRMTWGRKGAAMVADGEFDTFSPHWDVSIANSGDGMPKLYPTRLKSLGMTNMPNIEGVSPIANEEEEENMDLLARLVALIGKDDVKSEDDVIGYVQSAITGLKAVYDSLEMRWKAEDAARTVANEAGSLAGELTALLGLLDSKLQTSVANEIDGVVMSDAAKALAEGLKAELTVANERLESAVGFVVDGALATGRIAPKDKDAWTGKLRENFGSVANELDAIAPGTAMHVATETGARGAQRPELGDPKAGKRASAIRAKALSIANEHTGMSWQQCWEQAESTVGE